MANKNDYDYDKEGLGCNNCYACVSGGRYPCQNEEVPEPPREIVVRGEIVEVFPENDFINSQRALITKINTDPVTNNPIYDVTYLKNVIGGSYLPNGKEKNVQQYRINKIPRS